MISGKQEYIYAQSMDLLDYLAGKWEQTGRGRGVGRQETGDRQDEVGGGKN